jgi:hypothetical protein
MPTYADHAVKNYKFSNFLKQVKNVQKVKILKNHFGNLEIGKKTTSNFYFLSIFKKKNFLCMLSKCGRRLFFNVFPFPVCKAQLIGDWLENRRRTVWSASF